MNAVVRDCREKVLKNIGKPVGKLGKIEYIREKIDTSFDAIFFFFLLVRGISAIYFLKIVDGEKIKSPTTIYRQTHRLRSRRYPSVGMWDDRTDRGVYLGLG